MLTFVLIIHVISCVLLATIILMQSGRGGGLTESFASAESMFGAKTNEMLIKFTTIVAVVFFVTNISLAILNSREGRSLMSDKVVAQTKQDVTTDAKKDIVKDLKKEVDAKSVVKDGIKKVKDEASAKTE